MDPIFTDRVQFPHVYRTVPNQNYQHRAVVQLLRHFGWNWVGILSADDDSSERGSRDLKNLILSSGGCVEFMYTVSDKRQRENVEEKIQSSLSKVVIVNSDVYFTSSVILHLCVMKCGKVWIFLSGLTYFQLSEVVYTSEVLNGSLTFLLHKGNIPGLREFIYNVTPYGHKEDSLLKDVWIDLFGCYPLLANINGTVPALDLCSGDETLESVSLHLYDVVNFRIVHSIYTAVYIVAYSLHEMLMDKSHGIIMDPSIPERPLQPWKLNRYLKRLHFSSGSGDDIYFNEEGEVPRDLDLQNWFIKSSDSTEENRITLEDAQAVDVGTYNLSAPEDQRLVINDSHISWHQSFTGIPRSSCSESCEPGYRKRTESFHICCYSCVVCSEGEISNTSDADECVKCPEDHYSNEMRTSCLLKTTEFLSYDDGLGMCLALLSIILCMMTCAVLGIFWKYHQTPVVKANNQKISYVLLVSLLFSFLCSLLFIGRPMAVTCLLRQSVFGIFFTVSVSCVLAKSFLVVLAFKATRPGSKLKDWVGSGVSISVVVLCSVGQLIISMVWLISSPPFPDYDLQSDSKKMILRCNEGSAVAFYILIGYMGLLSLFSFLVAFLVRKLPASYNEAQLITFSMLLVCSVWISFIPAYLSTKGKYMVAVEVFAILTSSAGLLGCIFIPKCYIILVTPEMNTRQRLIGKQ
ncbi:vomeronasal type-2 receptor 26-like [Engystomops pustulosus]|uniref:vomeronasal type-2 receptor 26-like n=1 Tax=Engystomops pustulosus TaxID=76066 RepID=UPI003AFB3798